MSFSRGSRFQHTWSALVVVAIAGAGLSFVCAQQGLSAPEDESEPARVKVSDAKPSAENPTPETSAPESATPAKSDKASRAPAKSTSETVKTEMPSGTDSATAAGTKKKNATAAKKPDGPPIGEKTANLSGNDKDFETYLDRLMMAESGGRLNAKNPRSSALGPYQFIRSTFISVARRYFADEVKDLSDLKILALRTDLKFARRAAAAYSRENAAYLAGEGLKTTYGNLRLCFLLGPSGAARILKASGKTQVATLLGRGVMRANPFMVGMTAGELIARSNREISIDPARQLATTGLPKVRRGPRIRVRCNLSRPSCRKWLALKRAKLRSGSRTAARKKLKQRRRK